MITDKKEEVSPAKLNNYFNIEQIYSRCSSEERLKMQRIGEYANVIITYIRRNRMFLTETAGNYFDFTKYIFTYSMLGCSEADLDNIIYPEVPKNIIEIIKTVNIYHSENWDGSGFPQGLKGEAIPFSARVCRVAMEYERFVMEQGYEESEGNRVILEALEEESGTVLQPDIVEILAGCEAVLHKLDIEFGVL